MPIARVNSVVHCRYGFFQPYLITSDAVCGAKVTRRGCEGILVRGGFDKGGGGEV